MRHLEKDSFPPSWERIRETRRKTMSIAFNPPSWGGKNPEKGPFSRVIEEGKPKNAVRGAKHLNYPEKKKYSGSKTGENSGNCP